MKNNYQKLIDPTFDYDRLSTKSFLDFMPKSVKIKMKTAQRYFLTEHPGLTR